MSPRKLEHGFRMLSAYTLPYRREDDIVPSFWALLTYAAF